MVYRIAALGFTILFLSGCVVGRKHDFLQAQAVLDYHGQPLAVGVQDLRSYVVSGDKTEDFAGLARSGFGIPYDIGTESNRPLAQEMADVIAAALRGSGATVRTVNLSPNMGRTDIIRAMTSAGTDQSLLLSVREWKTDTFGVTALYYDLELEALDAQGQVLAEKSTRGEEELGGSAWRFDPQSHTQEVAPQAFRQKVELLYSGDIANALKRSPK
jgi:hypothetical protein